MIDLPDDLSSLISDVAATLPHTLRGDDEERTQTYYGVENIYGWLEDMRAQHPG